MKETKRKAFNFFRSYFDIYNELETPEEKAGFMDALLNKQFLNEEPEDLKGMVKFAYISQKHSIDKQVKGYFDKVEGMKKKHPKQDPIKDPIKAPTQGGKQDPIQDPSQQVQVQEKEQVQVQEEVKEQLTITSVPTKVETKVFSDEVNFVYDSVLPMFSERIQPKKEKEIESWKDCIDKLIRIDEVDANSIIHIVQKARSDDFWKTVFNSLVKLRKKNKEGVKYVDVFIEKFKKPIVPANYGTAESFKLPSPFKTLEEELGYE